MADQKDYISRASMVAAIEAGGCVEHKGRILTSVSQVPSPGELLGAEGLKEEEAELERRLEETRRKRADAEKATKAAEKAEAERKADAEKADADDEKAAHRKSAK